MGTFYSSLPYYESREAAVAAADAFDVINAFRRFERERFAGFIESRVYVFAGDTVYKTRGHRVRSYVGLEQPGTFLNTVEKKVGHTRLAVSVGKRFW